GGARGGVGVVGAVGAAVADDEAMTAAVRELLGKMKAGKSSERVEAVKALAKLKAEAAPAVRPLSEALYDDDFDVKAAARKALEGLGESTLPVLVKALDTCDVRRRIDAAWAIVALIDVQRHREDEDEGRRWLAKFRPTYEKQISPRLLAALDHKNEEWRYVALELMCSQADEAALPWLFRRASDAKADTAARVEALRLMGDFRARPRRAAAHLLCIIEKSEEPFGANLGPEESKSPIRDAAFIALDSLHEGSVPTYLRLLESPDERLVLEALRMCFSIPYPSKGLKEGVSPGLIRLALRHKSHEVRLRP